MVGMVIADLRAHLRRASESWPRPGALALLYVSVLELAGVCLLDSHTYRQYKG